MVAKMRWNNILLAVLMIILVLFPFVTNSRTLTILLTHIFIFTIFALSYDILLGYIGIVSFVHSMFFVFGVYICVCFAIIYDILLVYTCIVTFGHAIFFGIGAYTSAVMLKNLEPTITNFSLSIILGMLLAGLISFVIGLLTLRLHSHFFAMFTLAVSGLFLVIAEKWRTLTQGNDGFTFRAPELFADRTTFYLFVLVCLLIVFIIMRLFVQSPFGSVLIAVRENEKRTAALGYKAIYYKVMASVVAGVVASLAGSFYVISLRFVNTSVMIGRASCR